MLKVTGQFPGADKLSLLNLLQVCTPAPAFMLILISKTLTEKKKQLQCAVNNGKL